MRKFTTIVLILAFFGIFAGCAADDYSIERQYWRIQKRAEEIFKNPDASPPRQLELAVKRLENFSNKYQKSGLAIDAQFTIARLYIVKQEYDKGRMVMRALIAKQKKYENVCAEAMFLIGNSYELQDKWASALAEYKKIIEDYPVTIRGLDVPVYIAQHYKVKYQPDKMREALQEAIVHYKALADKFPDSILAFKANTLVAQIYVELKEWQNAINSMDLILEKYKGKVKLDAVLLEKALIYTNQIKDNRKAKETLEALIKDYPKSRLVEPAKKILSKMDGKK